MRVAFGVTAWAQGAASGHLDGIGIYTQKLWQALQQPSTPFDFQPLQFRTAQPAPTGTPQPLTLPYRYAQGLLPAVLSSLPFWGNRRLCRAFDLVHATDHHIPRLRGLPLIATVMDTIPITHPHWAFAKHARLKAQLFRKVLHWADHIITISAHSRADLITHADIAPERITVIPLGVEAQEFAPLPTRQREHILSRYHLQPGYFLFVGTLQPRKNLERLLAAHARLDQAARRRHPLIIVGQPGWCMRAFIDTLKQAARHEPVRWLEYVPRADLMVLYQGAQALVHPSLYEGFGLTILEGFASGIPVITANTTALPEVAGDAACLVDPYDVDAIAQAMQQIIDDPALRAHLIQAGQNRVGQFSWAACAQQTLHVYQRFAV
ncbi:glycosyltransferase family 4 protein [Thiorhodospira sibirica]|uniref:glycosyltransferase family 4 protein n=1 Tax=Thiorhodospira sibirica TaxID=154347 RepID=UPI00022C3A0E|nr:glycosyltransferase family 1 protein [Thiorhodospira sibirica]